MMARGAALREVAKSKLCRLLARNKTFNCAGIKVGDSVLFYEAPHRKSQPRWRGPASILDIDETGVMVKHQTQSFKVARYCVRKQVKEYSVGSSAGDIQDDERLLRLNTISPRISGDTWRSLGSTDGWVPDVAHPTKGVIDVESLDSPPNAAPDPPLDGTGPTPMSIDTQDPDEEVPPCEAPVPSSPTHSWKPLYEHFCGPSRVDAAEPETSATDLKRPRSPSCAQEKRVSRDALQVSLVANKNFAKDHASWRNPTLKSQINLAAVAPIDGVESAISARAALACEKALGQELCAQEEHLRVELVASAKTKDLEARVEFKVFTPVRSSSLPESPVDTRLFLARKMVGGKKSAKARLAAKGFQDPDLQGG